MERSLKQFPWYLVRLRVKILINLFSLYIINIQLYRRLSLALQSHFFAIIFAGYSKRFCQLFNISSVIIDCSDTQQHILSARRVAEFFVSLIRPTLRFRRSRFYKPDFWGRRRKKRSLSPKTVVRIIHRRLLFKSNYVLGYKICFAGRFWRRGTSVFKWFKKGNLPLSDYSSFVGYHSIGFHLPYGACGVKVWIYYYQPTNIKESKWYSKVRLC